MLPLPVEFEYEELRKRQRDFAALPPDQREKEFKFCAARLRIAKDRHRWLVFAGVFSEDDET